MASSTFGCNLPPDEIANGRKRINLGQVQYGDGPKGMIRWVPS
uniref:Uncharacterized protein n=1 Tax=Tetranychus urticae TaxID=32264 RepID=T1KTF0_TETUR